MLTKEQEETYQEIQEFYGIVEEIVIYVENEMDYSNYCDVLDKLEIVEDLIKSITGFSEFMSLESYKISNDSEYLDEKQKSILEKKCIELLLSLNKCRSKLEATMNIKNE